jgi:hypothetical protein
MIDQVTIDRILDAAQIVDVVSEFVTLRKRGVNYVGLCPFHNEKTPSFSVSPAKGLCKCFSCGKGGNSVHFIMEHEQMSYYEALKYLAKKYNIEIKERELTNEEKQAQTTRESMFIVNNFARDYFQNILKNHVDTFVAAPDWVAAKGMRMLAAPIKGDTPVTSGESGAAPFGTLACIMCMDEYQELREHLGLDETSRVLLFSTEGDTDPTRYESIVWDGNER